MSALHPSPTAGRPDGLSLAPFVGLRYADGLPLGRLLAPPYDVIDADRRRELKATDPHNVVHLTLPDPSSDGYREAADLLGRWRSDGTLRPDAVSALYVYEQGAAGHTQRGLLGALALTPAEDGIVLPHENTMAGPVADRLALGEATEANLEPIFCVYDGGGTASEVVAGVGDVAPLAEAETPDRTRHRLWAVTDPDILAAVAADLHPRSALIADGHHRYATYLQQQRRAREAGRGDGPWDRGLTFLVDAGRFGPQVQAIHRFVPGLPLQPAVEAAAAGFRVSPVELSKALATLEAVGGPAFVVSDGRNAWLLDAPDPERLAAAMPPERSEAWRRLDVTVAHQLLFSSLWRLDDTPNAIGFAHDVDDALDRARAAAGVAVLLAPTPVAAVGAVAAAGERMPRKSTLFVPKPATGVVLRAFADQPVGMDG